jgi:hypothetical protein
VASPCSMAPAECLDELFSHRPFTVPELLYLRKELISVQAKLFYGVYCLIRLQARKAHEPDPEFSPISCRFLSPEESTQSRSQPSSQAVSQSQSILSFFSRVYSPPAPSTGSSHSLSQPLLSLSLTGPSLSPAVLTSTSSSSGLPPSQPSLSSYWRRRASSPVLAPALLLPRYPKRDNRVQMGHAEDLPIQQDVTMDGRLSLDFAPQQPSVPELYIRGPDDYKTTWVQPSHFCVDGGMGLFFEVTPGTSLPGGALLAVYYGRSNVSLQLK